MRQKIEKIVEEMPANATCIKMHLRSSSGTLALIRRVIVACVQHLGLTSTTLEGVKLATTEACTNIIKHAYKFDETKSFDMELKSSCNVFVIELLYSDPGFEPCNIPIRNLKEVREGGYGVFLMQNIMDYVNYATDTKTGEVRLQMVKILNSEKCSGGSSENRTNIK